MIIEFTGIPGSGKTTLNDALHQFLVARGYQVWKPIYYWRQIGRNQKLSFSERMLFIFRKLIVCLKTVRTNFHLMSFVPWRHILAEQSFQNKWLCLSSFMTNLAEREAAENLVPHNTIALMDEGIFHRSYSLFVTPEKYLDIKGILLYGRAVKLPDLLIYLKSPVPACLDRICRRELPVRMRGLKRSVALKMMIKGETALNVLIKDLRQRQLNNINVLELDCQDPVEAKNKLFDWIENFLPVR